MPEETERALVLITRATKVERWGHLLVSEAKK